MNYGTLKAIGVSETPIVFTSFLDDEYGGDSNSDGNSSLPAPGNWLSLYFAKESQNSQMENVVIRYGGAVLGSSPLGWGHAVWADGADISIKDSVIEKNKNRALTLVNSHSIIDNVRFLDNNSTSWPSGFDESKALLVKGGKPQIKNSYFEGNSQALYIESYFDPDINAVVSAEPVIENNEFVKNGSAIDLAGESYPLFSGNVATENTYNAVTLGFDFSKNAVLKPDLPYLIRGRVLSVAENTTLTLEPGVILQFRDNLSGLKIDGTLKAVAVRETPIIFRSYYYDRDWVLPGNWLGLKFTEKSRNSELENIEISLGGGYYVIPSSNDFSSAIKVEQSAISLKNSKIFDNANNGLWLVNSSSVIDNVDFENHLIETTGQDPRGILVQGGKPEIKNSLFKNNYYGIYLKTWTDPATGKEIPAEPVLENNEFDHNLAGDVYP